MLDSIVVDTPFYQWVQDRLEQQVKERKGILYENFVKYIEEKSKEEGLREGRWETTFSMLRQFLAHRYKVPESTFDEQLRQLDLTELKRLTDIAMIFDTQNRFEEALTNILAMNKPKPL